MVVQTLSYPARTFSSFQLQSEGAWGSDSSSFSRDPAVLDRVWQTFCSSLQHFLLNYVTKRFGWVAVGLGQSFRQIKQTRLSHMGIPPRTRVANQWYADLYFGREKLYEQAYVIACVQQLDTVTWLTYKAFFFYTFKNQERTNHLDGARCKKSSKILSATFPIVLYVAKVY